MNFRRLTCIACCLLAIACAVPLCADELKFDAAALLARSVADHLVLNEEQDAIQLQRGVLYEDDGPAAGYSYLPNEEKLKGGVWIKKELLIPAPQAETATLLVGRGGELTARINSQPTPLKFLGNEGNYWQAYRFDPQMLRGGSNEIVLTGEGGIWIARDDEFAAGSLTRTNHPNRSAKSVDEGKTWNDAKIGSNNDIDGEYYVRVFLDQFQSRGVLTLPVIDVGNLNGKPIGPPVDRVGPIRLHGNATVASGGKIQLRARTGTTFVPDDKTWSAWAAVDFPAGKISQPTGRYLQIEIALATDDPLRSPRLKQLTIAVSPTRSRDWTKDVQITHFDNQQIVRSSIPFAYEPFDRPELAKLRRDFGLDDVIAGAKTEFELIERLAAWSSKRWERMHLKESYPPYNALEILQAHEDGTPVGGFCQQYNVVFLQACESFGLVGRLVSIGPGNRTDKIRGGHETVEIWSNDYGKWVYVDGNTAWYAVDEESQVPLSLWELRQRQLAAFAEEDYAPIDVVVLAQTKHKWPSLTQWPPLVELRLIPRSDFLARSTPLPLNQGMRGWFWTGHYVWTDKKSPARLLYSHRIARRANFEWTLNQAHFTLEAADDPGHVRVHIDTETPHFAEFVTTQNGETTVHAENAFHWRLRTGKNEFRTVPRNTARRTGIASTLELIYEPSAE